MIAMRRSYSRPIETSDNLTFDMLLDEESLRVLLSAYTAKIATAADILQDSTIDDERMDIINHIRDLSHSAISIIETIKILQDHEDNDGTIYP